MQCIAATQIYEWFGQKIGYLQFQQMIIIFPIFHLNGQFWSILVKYPVLEEAKIAHCHTPSVVPQAETNHEIMVSASYEDLAVHLASIVLEFLPLSHAWNSQYAQKIPEANFFSSDGDVQAPNPLVHVGDVRTP